MPLREAKMKPTATSIAQHLAAIPDEHRRKDCEALIEVMQRVLVELIDGSVAETRARDR